MGKQIKSLPPAKRGAGKEAVPIRNLKKRTVPKADGRYIVFYDRP